MSARQIVPFSLTVRNAHLWRKGPGVTARTAQNGTGWTLFKKFSSPFLPLILSTSKDVPFVDKTTRGDNHENPQRNQERNPLLQRKYHKELTIYRMRRATEEVHCDYARAVADQQETPKPLEIIRRIADKGFRLTTWMHLHNYLDKVREAGDVPEPRRMLLALLPWAGRASTTACLCGNCRRRNPVPTFVCSGPPGSPWHNEP